LRIRGLQSAYFGRVCGVYDEQAGKIYRSFLENRFIRQLRDVSVPEFTDYPIPKNMKSKKTSWTVLPLERDLGTYKAVWDKLNSELYDSNPYFDSKFIEPLLTHFSTGNERLCIHRQGADIDGLVIVTSHHQRKWSLFLPAQAQIAPVLVRYTENLRNLLHSLPGLSLGLDLVRQDPLYNLFSGTIQDLLWSYEPHAHTMSISLDGEFQDYVVSRSGKFRNNHSRRLRKTQEVGLAIHTKRLTESEQMKEAITRFGNMETMGWKGAQGTAVHSDNIQGRFYIDVMRNFSMYDKGSVYELYFNDVLVAMQLCIASQSMLVMLKTTYDESQASFAPGRLLLYFLLEEEFAAKRVQMIEFYTNADSNELTWSTHDRWISDYLLLRNKFIREIFQKTKQLRHRFRGVSIL